MIYKITSSESVYQEDDDETVQETQEQMIKVEDFKMGDISIQRANSTKSNSVVQPRFVKTREDLISEHFNKWNIAGSRERTSS